MDNKSKIEIVITSIAVIFLIFLIFSQIKKRKKPKEEKVPSAIEKVKIAKHIRGEKKTSPKSDEELLALQRERANLPWGRDPFFFSNVKKVFKGSALMLKGISLGKDGKGYVFINNDIYTVGDKVGDYTIMEIERDRILLRKGNNSFYLSMPEE